MNTFSQGTQGFCEVRPDVFWFHPERGGEVHVVRTPDGLVLFDTSFVTEQDALLRAMAAADLNPADIRLGFMSHLHCDHVGAMGRWKKQFGFPVVAHEQAVGPVESGDTVITGASIPYANFEETFVPCAIDHAVRDEEVFTVGGRTFSVSRAPGHSVGSLHVLSEDVLVVGDTLFANGMIGWMDVHWGSNPEDYVETLRRMRPHTGLLALPGHGRPYVLENALIDHAIEVVSFYIPSGHGLGTPRAPSQYA